MIVSVASGPQYSASKLPRAHRPPKARPYDEYRNCLRREFSFTCAYCLSTEPEIAGSSAYGGFEIEHFKPKGLRIFRRLRSFYGNLLWSCHACNRAKREKWPSKAEVGLGSRFVDPSTEPLGSYLEIVGVKVVAVGGNAPGEYMIEEINLNSGLHVERRRQRAEQAKRFALLEGTFEALVARVGPGASVQERQDIDRDAAKIQRQLTEWRDSFDRGRMPWDAPITCKCP